MNLHPFHVVAKNAETKIADGWDVYQQFNCAACGVKQTMPDKNKFYERGRCQECGHVTDIVKDGCNFMATLALKSYPTPERTPK
jgi:DNA-directed RNA polymerase subunit RPC12/RpoP